MPKDQPGNFRKVVLRPDDGDNTEVYARVYDDGHKEIVGRNLKLDIKQAAFGKGPTAQWAFGDNWKVKPMPWEASAVGSGETYTPDEDE